MPTTEQRRAIKAAGGQVYADLLGCERQARAKFRSKNPDKIRSAARANKRARPFKTNLVRRARARGRLRGLPATVKVSDIAWPTHCPVLGIELDYPDRTGARKGLTAAPNWPSLDRWDSTKGYVPGNVFVVSMRANTIKSNATWQELEAVVRYARDGLDFMRLVA